MQYAIILAALASLAAAQSSSVTSSAAPVPTGGKCLAQTTLDVCVASINGQINSCATTDYSCLCTQYVNLLTCYQNCPNDTGVSSVQQLHELNCNNASVYGSTTTYGTATSTASAASATGSGSDSTAVQTGFASGTESGSGSSATGSDSGAASLEVASGLVALAAAGVGLLL